MYNTPLGIRILQGAERRLFVETLAMIADDLSVADGPFGIKAFDELQRNQKIAVLHSVARALLLQNQPAPKLTAAIEAAVASVFQRARGTVSLELSGELEPGEAAFANAPSWRDLVRNACSEAKIFDDLLLAFRVVVALEHFRHVFLERSEELGHRFFEARPLPGGKFDTHGHVGSVEIVNVAYVSEVFSVVPHVFQQRLDRRRFTRSG